MATGYEDIDNLVKQQNSLLSQQEQKQNDIIKQQTQMQVDELNREKEKLQKETDKTTQGLYANWQKQANQYGAGAEQLAQQGLGNSGYAETTRTALYNTYQKSVTDTLNNSRDLYADYNFKIQQARQNGSIQQAQSALELYSQRLQLLTQNYELRQNREQYLYQQQRDKVADSQWQKTFDQQARQNEIENSWKQKQFDYQKSIDDRQFNYQNKQFEYQKQRDKVADSQWQQQFNLQKKTASSRRSSSGSSSSRSRSGAYKISDSDISSSGIGDFAKNLVKDTAALKESTNSLKDGAVKNERIAKTNSLIEEAKDRVAYMYSQGGLSREEVDYIFNNL